MPKIFGGPESWLYRNVWENEGFFSRFSTGRTTRMSDVPVLFVLSHFKREKRTYVPASTKKNPGNYRST